MECSDGIAPFVKEDAFWKHDNSNSDELELDFDVDVKEESDAKTEDSNRASLPFSSIRNGGSFYRNDTTPTCATVDSTNDETVVTSTNEKPESRTSVPTGLLLYRLFNQIIIDALLSSNNHVADSSNNNNNSSNKIKSNENSLSSNAKVDSLSSTQEWIDKHYFIFKSNSLNNDSEIDIGDNCNTTCSNSIDNRADISNANIKGLDSAKSLAFITDESKLNVKTSLLASDKKSDKITSSTRSVTGVAASHLSDSLIFDQYKNTNVSRGDRVGNNVSDISYGDVGRSAEEHSQRNVNTSTDKLKEHTCIGTQNQGESFTCNVSNVNCEEGFADASYINETEDSSQNLEGHTMVTTEHDLVLNDNRVDLRKILINKIKQKSFENLRKKGEIICAEDIAVCPVIGRKRCSSGSLSGFLSSDDEDSDVTDQCSSTGSGISNLGTCDELDESSVTSVKSLITSECNNFVKRRSIIDDKIINDVFECFKRKLIETINIEIIHSINVDRRQSIDSSCDVDNEDFIDRHSVNEGGASEFDCDTGQDVSPNQNIDVSGIILNLGDDVNISSQCDSDMVCDKSSFDNVDKLSAVNRISLESFSSDVVCSTEKFNHGDKMSIDSTSCESNDILNVKHKFQMIPMNHSKNMYVNESSILKRKLSVPGVNSTSSLDSFSNKDGKVMSNSNIIKKIKLDPLSERPLNESESKERSEGKVSDAIIGKQYVCVNCNTNRKFIFGASCTKRKYLEVLHREESCCHVNSCDGVGVFTNNNNALIVDKNIHAEYCDGKGDLVNMAMDSLKSNDCQHRACSESLNNLNICKNHKIYCRNKNFDCNLKLRCTNDADSYSDPSASGNRSDCVRDRLKPCRYLCNICGTTFQDDEAFNEHLETHVFNDSEVNEKLSYITCQICSIRYYVKSLYFKHLNLDHKKDLCTVCNELFDLDVKNSLHPHRSKDGKCLSNKHFCSGVFYEHNYSKYDNEGTEFLSSSNNDCSGVIVEEAIKESDGLSNADRVNI